MVQWFTEGGGRAGAGKEEGDKKVNHQPKADKYKRGVGGRGMEIQIIDPKRLSSFPKTKQIFWLEGVAGGGRGLSNVDNY